MGHGMFIMTMCCRFFEGPTLKKKGSSPRKEAGQRTIVAIIITIMIANTIILMLSLMTAAITTVTAMTIAAMTIRDNGTRKPDIT